jgi:soluble lytic murein transglycosylase-like protein
MTRTSYVAFAFASLVLTVPATTSSALAHEALIAKHAAANGVPESLVHRVIRIESRGNPRAVSKGNYGLMQIRLGTARAMGYGGGAAGLLDADTNMTYAVRYLAGAYRAAGGNADRAVSYYQRGYYYQAKARGFSPYAAAQPAAVKRIEAESASEAFAEQPARVVPAPAPAHPTPELHKPS